MFKLFLDDIRIPFNDQNNWIIARTFDKAIEIIEKYDRLPNVISFDHDLGFTSNGKEQNGYDLAKWIIEADMNGKYKIPSDFTYYIHSANPIGRDNIDGLFKSYFKVRN